MFVSFVAHTCTCTSVTHHYKVTAIIHVSVTSRHFCNITEKDQREDLDSVNEAGSLAETSCKNYKKLEEELLAKEVEAQRN